jgi:hypothetical protein
MKSITNVFFSVNVHPKTELNPKLEMIVMIEAIPMIVIETIAIVTKIMDMVVEGDGEVMAITREDVISVADVAMINGSILVNSDARFL